VQFLGAVGLPAAGHQLQVRHAQSQQRMAAGADVVADLQTPHPCGIVSVSDCGTVFTARWTPEVHRQSAEVPRVAGADVAEAVQQSALVEHETGGTRSGDDD
jgi:hypothetical protein